MPMRRSSERSLALGLVVALVFNAACGGEDDSNGTATSGGAAGVESSAESAGTPARPVGGEPAAAKSPAMGSDAPSRAGIGGRTRELVNPEAESVVMLYHALSQLAFPFDRVIGEDMRVSMAKPIDKQAQRDAVRAELEGALAAVKDVGSLRISMNANLSDYDPTYGEFTVRALAPSSVVTFDAFREHVELRFDNGLAAQTWKVPADEAQLVRDKIGQFQSASVDVLVRITGVQPAAGGGGTLQTEIVEYELRADPSGERLTRVRVAE
jgi:hypothetical protein